MHVVETRCKKCLSRETEESGSRIPSSHKSQRPKLPYKDRKLRLIWRVCVGGEWMWTESKERLRDSIKWWLNEVQREWTYWDPYLYIRSSSRGSSRRRWWYEEKGSQEATSPGIWTYITTGGAYKGDEEWVVFCINRGARSESWWCQLILPVIRSNGTEEVLQYIESRG